MNNNMNMISQNQFQMVLSNTITILQISLLLLSLLSIEMIEMESNNYHFQSNLNSNSYNRLHMIERINNNRNNQNFNYYKQQQQRYRQQRTFDDELDFSLNQDFYNNKNNNYDANNSSGNDTNDDNENSLPEFVGHVPNITVQIGREARLACIIKNLQTYSSAWIRDDTKSILTLQTHIITRDPRISLLEENQIDSQTAVNYVGLSVNDLTESFEPLSLSMMDNNNYNNNRIRYFILVIRNVQFSDRGGYMCQISTVPMRKQIGYIKVVVPPDIIDSESSNDVLVREGENVTLKCKARGFPDPLIEWRREDGARVPLGSIGQNNRRIMVNKTEGELLEISRVTRVHSGAWLCIASNGVMPSVSRRILLNVQFAPQIWIPIEEIGGPFGSNITIDCHIEAYPLPLNYWTFGLHSQSIYISGPKYEVSVKEKGYKRHLKLTIQSLSSNDLGIYQCHAHNLLGRQVKQVKVYASKFHQQSQSKLEPNDYNSQLHPISKQILATNIKQRNITKSKRKRKRKKITASSSSLAATTTATTQHNKWHTKVFDDDKLKNNLYDQNKSSGNDNDNDDDDDDEYQYDDYNEDLSNNCINFKSEILFTLISILFSIEINK